MNESIEFTKIKHDVNGNPRYVCHFLNFVTDEEQARVGTGVGFVSELYKLALKRAHKVDGRKFSNRQYGGGIVFVSYNIRDTEQAIREIVEKESQS